MSKRESDKSGRYLVTRDELWLEFKKVIDSGNNCGFTTRSGMNRYLRCIERKHPGKSICFKFIVRPDKFVEYYVMQSGKRHEQKRK